VRYWEDIKAGEVIELGRRAVTKEAILTFAREFDPQPFHADEAAAQRTIWGGLIASGWHTGSMLMRLFYDGFLKDTVSLGSPGIDELKWLKPVRPGDTLSGRLTILETAPSLERDGTLELGVVCKPDLRHRALTEARLEPVSARKELRVHADTLPLCPDSVKCVVDRTRSALREVVRGSR